MGMIMIKIRKVIEKDHKQVLELVENIWGGGDYIPFIFFNWVRDGGFFLAEYDGEPAGLAKVTMFDKGDWWLEGLRVGRRFRGLKIANHLTDFILGDLRKRGYNSIQYATGADNKASLYIGMKHGFVQLGKFTFHSFFPNPTLAINHKKMFKVHDAEKIFHLLFNSELIKKTSGTIPMSWTFRKLSKEFISSLSKSGNIITAGDIDTDGFAIYQIKDGFNRLEILWLETRDISLQEYLRFFNAQVLKKLDYSITITVPVYTRIIPAFSTSGLKLDWKHGVRLLEYQK